MTAGKTISEAHGKRLIERGLNLDLCVKLGVHSQGQAIAFDYIVDGEVWNTKVRHGKGNMPWTTRDKQLRLWNVDSLAAPVQPKEILVITEGEFDTVACIQAGFERVVSVPSGADDTKYAYLLKQDGKLIPELQKFVDAKCKIVLAVDGDDKGKGLRNRLSQRIGDSHCWWVSWPEGCKDANDVLQQEGENFLRNEILAARAMWNDEVASIDDIPDPGPQILYRTGISGMDENIMFELPEFMVMMGPSGCGKSVFLRQLLWSLWKTHGWMFLLTALEERVKWRILNHFRRMEIGRPPKLYTSPPQEWTEEEIYLADREVVRAGRFLMRPKYPDKLTVSHFLTRVEMAIKRDGVRVVALDPVNELDHEVGANESQYWTKFIMDCKQLADDYGILFIVSGHPPKDAYRRIGQGNLLTLVDMFGSANWGPKADHGLCFWKLTEPGPTYMHMEKSKDNELMGRRGLLELTHQPMTNTFQITNRGFDLIKKVRGEG